MTVPAAGRVLDVIEVFARVRRPMTVTALAKMLELPASSCHGLVKTLEERGYLIKLAEPAGYYFSKRLEQLTQRIGGYDPLPSWVIPALEATRDAADETTLLARMTGLNAVYVEVLESAQSVRYIAQVGDLRPLYASAAGKALLGSLPPDERAAVVSEIELVKRNPRTIVKRSALLQDLETSEQRGWYKTSGEFLSDVTAVAAPVQLGQERYAIVIAGPSARMEPKLKSHVQLIKAFVARAARG
jgi:IclR family transcriptional regulator, acetate operon repressor